MAYIDDRAIDVATQYGMFMNAQGDYKPVRPITRTAQSEYKPVVPITRTGENRPISPRPSFKGVNRGHTLCDGTGWCSGETQAQGGAITRVRDSGDKDPIGLPLGSRVGGDILPIKPFLFNKTSNENARSGRIIDRDDPTDLHFDGSNRMFLDNDNGPTDLWFNQSGDNVITVGGDKYSFQPVLSWNSGCDTMDDNGDGIFPNQNCKARPGVGGVPGLGVSALRWKNGKMY
jgi:hypothetical protein